jgi:hypothetical protein
MAKTPMEVVTALARLELPDPPLDRALAAIEELVEAAVRGKRRTRFADAARICAVGTQLLSATAEGVLDDPALGCDDGLNIGVGGGGYVFNPNRQGVA